MLSRYQQLFHASGSIQFALAGLLARLALPMMGIGIITMLSMLQGSYALAGGVSATFVLTYALLSPQISRQVDSLGQFRVLPLVTFISVLGMGLIVASTWLGLSYIWLFLGAFLSGFMPSMSAMIRARWSQIYKGDPLLQTAYSLETVFDDLTFIAGPPLSVGLTVVLFPQAGIMIAGILLLVGVLLLVSQRKTEPALVDKHQIMSTKASILRLPSLQLLIILMISLGVIVGTVDILSVTLAQIQGQPAMASLVLSLYAIGSCVMGVVFGGMRLSMPLPRMLLISGVLTLLSIIPLLWVGGIWSLSMVMFISGLFFAPTMIIGMSLVENIVPDHRLTEGMTWLLAGLNIGVAFGAMLSGKMVDELGIYAGYWVAIAGGILVVVCSLMSYGLLMRQETAVCSS
ncbi:MFS transporter [Providencia sp. JGM181]|uniref:MFS transporter n=1 Tax=unclassified Providencia TaxID=2633465 RepID=UPI001BA7F38C|nr:MULTISPECIES: MFS transporter [unclassified Providencia]MBS0924251.1 MFS transporter [Providencia sp. JGM181]MBS0932595.1 MFS transporter [Providencia sp. JGM172]MBS0996788.1 MFS transporter [Providencia sp. JGM178]